jgi:hypothetical protein
MKFTGDTGKVKAQVAERMDEQAREMQADSEKFVCEIKW